MKCPTKISPDTYSEKYFTSLNYSDYLEREDRYMHTAMELADIFNKLTLVKPEDKILDYGCGVGFMLKGFEKAGFNSIYGYDISKWASKEAEKRGVVIGKVHLKTLKPELMLALDVFEHMLDDEIKPVMWDVGFPPLIVRIPVSTDGKNFHLKVSRRDVTHINCKTKLEWMDFFKDMGYSTFLALNLISIFDSPGVMATLIL